MRIWKRVDRETGEITRATENQVRDILSYYYRNVPAVLRDASEKMPACTPWCCYYPEGPEK